jgi:predicted deacylase
LKQRVLEKFTVEAAAARLKGFLIEAGLLHGAQATAPTTSARPEMDDISLASAEKRPA